MATDEQSTAENGLCTPDEKQTIPPASPTPEVSSTDEEEGDTSDAESIGGQRNLLSKKTLFISVGSLSICLFVSFIDQTSVSTATPAMGEELETGTSTPWIGASFLIASTAFQLINGRLSDIFGRKNLLIICLVLMALGDLACGFAQTAVQLFAFRSVAGIGGGGVNSLVMIIVSDITTLENRGNIQGALGAIIAIANGVGPFLGGVIVESSTWRWVFWMIPIITIPTMLAIWFYLPLKHRSGDYVAKMRRIDYGGIFLNIASTLLVLIPFSGGGVSYAWNSPFLISAISVGAVLAVLFVLYEWKLARLPIMPLRLYQAPHCSALYMQTFLTGLAYFGNFFYLPLYFQSVLKYTPLVSGALILPLVISTSITSILSGQYMSRIGSYMHPILGGFVLWTLGSGLTLLFDQHTGLGPLIGILIVEGAGIGFTLQPTLVGMYANSRSEDRAVTTGLRNFIRTIGGAFGLVVAGVILSNTLRQQLLGTGTTDETIAQLTSSAYGLDEMGLGEAEKERILEAYMDGLYYIFIFFTACAGLSVLLTVLVGNTSLKQPKKPAETSPEASSEEEATPATSPQPAEATPATAPVQGSK